MRESINKEFNLIMSFKIIIFLLIVLQGLILNNTIMTFIGFIFIFFLEKRFLLSIILLTPIIETVLFVGDVFTITMIIAIFFTFYFLYVIIEENAKIIDKRSSLLFAYLFIVIIGLFNAIAFGEFLPFINWNYKKILREHLISFIPKILFTFLLYSYIKAKGYNYLRDNLRYACFLMTGALIIISLYFITIGKDAIRWLNVSQRLTFIGADPNEFASIFAAIGIFPLYLILKGKTTAEVVIGIISTVLVYYSIFLTLSRGGTLTLIFSIILTFFVFSKKNIKRICFVLSIGIIIIIILLNFEIIDFSPLYERFFGEEASDISSLTSGRVDWWRSGIKAIKQRPILGFGGSSSVSLWITSTTYGRSYVMHNLFMEILVQYGILGLSVFLWLIVRILKDFKQLISKLNKGQLKDDVFLIPFISALTVLFASLSLSWQWSELLWYFISVCLVIGNLFFSQKQF